MGAATLKDITLTCKRLCSDVGLQDPYNLERVFWLMLGRDGAAVKSMMENFQHLHKHPLPEEHRRLVLMVDM